MYNGHVGEGESRIKDIYVKVIMYNGHLGEGNHV